CTSFNGTGVAGERSRIIFAFIVKRFRVFVRRFNGSTTFADYKDVSGVKMPYSITVNQMGMDMVMKVKSYEVNQAKDSDFK
ncbi:hypothetical protein, partial [Chryseobacterium indoltheticum]|uniref:hypothetical protein n=1 Tax=Chryseobacterium indoltheticum TaxID=254 RepID=UPI003F4957D2